MLPTFAPTPYTLRQFTEANKTTNPYIFGMREKTRTPAENSQGHMETAQTPHEENVQLSGSCCNLERFPLLCTTPSILVSTANLQSCHLQMQPMH